MKYDDIISCIGQFGRYQKRIYALVCLPVIPIAAHTMITVFILAIPDHRCVLPHMSNDTFVTQSQTHSLMLNQSVPTESDGSYSECRLYGASHQPGSGRSYDTASDNVTGHLDGMSDWVSVNNETGYLEEKQCTDWVYDKTIYEDSLITQFDLVCEQKMSRSHAQMFFMLGALCGSLFLGPPADFLGRKKVMVVSILLHVIASFAIALTPSVVYLYTFLFINGVAVTALYIILFVLGVELVGPDMRRFAGFIIVFFYSLGIAAVAGVAYFVRNWQTLQLIMAAVPVPFLVYFWILPESPRWLISRGRFEEAEVIIRKAAKENRRALPDKAVAWAEFQADISTNEPFWHIVKYPKLVLRTLIIFVDWMICSMTYFGLGLNVGDLAGSVYLNCILFGLVEIPSYVLCIWLLDRLGRRRLYLALIFLAGIACTTSPLPVIYGGQDLQWLTVVLAVVGKFGVSGAFATIWVYSSEVFPTVIRNTGVSTSSVCARVGGIISPYIANLTVTVGGNLGRLLPLVIFGGLSLASGLMSLALPETRHLKLPDTLREADQFGRRDSAAKEVEMEELKPLDHDRK